MRCVACRQDKPEDQFNYKGLRAVQCLDCIQARIAVERAQARKAREKRKALGRNVSPQVFAAIRKGILVRPSACEQCGRTGEPIHAHHDDYSKPLDVQWLCKLCHTWADMDRRARERESAITAPEAA